MVKTGYFMWFHDHWDPIRWPWCNLIPWLNLYYRLDNVRVMIPGHIILRATPLKSGEGEFLFSKKFDFHPWKSFFSKFQIPNGTVLNNIDFHYVWGFPLFLKHTPPTSALFNGIALWKQWKWWLVVYLDSSLCIHDVRDKTTLYDMFDVRSIRAMGCLCIINLSFQGNRPYAFTFLLVSKMRLGL